MYVHIYIYIYIHVEGQGGDPLEVALPHARGAAGDAGQPSRPSDVY